MIPSPTSLAAELQVYAVRHSLLAEAMRSGEHTPTKFVLMNEAGECCATGLACLLAELGGARIRHRLIHLDLTKTLADVERCYRFESMDRTYGESDILCGSSSHMIEEVMEYYNWSTPHGAFYRPMITHYASYSSLADANDQGVPWDVLADWIEEGRVR